MTYVSAKTFSILLPSTILFIVLPNITRYLLVYVVCLLFFSLSVMSKFSYTQVSFTEIFQFK